MILLAQFQDNSMACVFRAAQFLPILRFPSIYLLGYFTDIDFGLKFVAKAFP